MDAFKHTCNMSYCAVSNCVFKFVCNAHTVKYHVLHKCSLFARCAKRCYPGYARGKHSIANIMRLLCTRLGDGNLLSMHKDG